MSINIADPMAEAANLGAKLRAALRLDDVDFSDVDPPSVLGFSALDGLVKVNPATLKALLGVSAFIQTLLNDADQATALTTLGAQPINVLLTALAALTTANGKIIKATGLNTVAMMDVIGTVAYLGGVAGALYEEGSYANGTYIRLACNLQICHYLDATGQSTDTVAGPLFQSAAAMTWSFPAPFASAAVFAINSPNAYARWGQKAAPTATAVNFRQLGVSNNATLVPQHCFAIGPWR